MHALRSFSVLSDSYQYFILIDIIYQYNYIIDFTYFKIFHNLVLRSSDKLSNKLKGDVNDNANKYKGARFQSSGLR